MRMNHFTPVTALAGGLLIGLATASYLLYTGRYAGISGIVRGAAFGDSDRMMDVLFITGLVLGGLVYGFMRPASTSSSLSLWVVAAGGVFVGLGTSLGGGCTSGHGVCGLGRFSGRALIAVVAFIATGMMTVFLFRHVFAGA
ncbi:MAG: YeeE/YedE family protein [Candidatus Velthaea sp.]